MSKWPDQTDMGIIGYLRQDGRMPNTKIAQNLGISEGSVRRRIRRMTGENLVRTVAFVDHARLGYTVEAVISIQADPTKATEVAKKMTEFPQVRYVGIAVGEYDIIATACFRSNQELLSFLTGEIARLDGITRTQTSLILDVMKHIHDWAPMMGK
ncbi:Lrp/AsnC family transcriptional regulator [Chloroflexota bacterium]